jgi:hypothetical protein
VSATNTPDLSLSAYAGDITKGISVYGAQFEVGSYATSYIPTLAAAVTRGADACYKTGISSLIGQTEGTIFVDFVHDIAVTTDENSRISLSDGTTDQWLILAFPDSGTKLLRIYVNVNGDALSLYSSTPVLQGRNKAVFGYKSGSFTLHLNGVQVAESSVIRSMPPTSRVDLQGWGPGQPAQDRENLSNFMLFKTRLSNAQLTELTTL